MNERTIPPTAAMRAHRPSSVPRPTATSPNATRTPSGTATWVRGLMSEWIGLRRAAPASWASIEAGLDASKKPGLASFCSPAKTKVKPRKARSGSRAHPAEKRARGGGPSHCGSSHCLSSWRPRGAETGSGAASREAVRLAVAAVGVRAGALEPTRRREAWAWGAGRPLRFFAAMSLLVLFAVLASSSGPNLSPP